MIDVTLHNPVEVARARIGWLPVVLGQVVGVDVAGRVRDRVAERLASELRAHGIDATIDRRGGSRLTVTVDDASQAARDAGGWLADVGSRLLPAAVDAAVARHIRQALREENVDADVQVR